MAYFQVLIEVVLLKALIIVFSNLQAIDVVLRDVKHLVLKLLVLLLDGMLGALSGLEHVLVLAHLAGALDASSVGTASTQRPAYLCKILLLMALIQLSLVIDCCSLTPSLISDLLHHYLHLLALLVLGVPQQASILLLLLLLL